MPNGINHLQAEIRFPDGKTYKMDRTSGTIGFQFGVTNLYLQGDGADTVFRYIDGTASLDVYLTFVTADGKFVDFPKMSLPPQGGSTIVVSDSGVTLSLRLESDH